jgi:hypothetical protein
MKKLLYTFLAVSIIFSACKKEENNNPTGTTTIVYGCTDTNAINYTPTATVDDSSCTYSGCMDSTATNYNPLATVDDGSCVYGIVGIWTATNVVGDSSFIVSYMGVTVDSLSSSGTITATPEMAGSPTSLEFLSSGTAYAEFLYDNEIDTVTYSTSGNTLTITDSDGGSFDIDYTVSQSDLALVDGGSQDTSVIVDFGTGPMTLDISYSYSNSLNFTRNTNGIVNNNVSQRLGNTNHSWFTKPKLNDILKTIK